MLFRFKNKSTTNQSNLKAAHSHRFMRHWTAARKASELKMEQDRDQIVNITAMRELHIYTVLTMFWIVMLTCEIKHPLK